MLTNLIKAAASVALAPVAVVADVLTLPSTAHDGKPAFGLTGALLKNAGQCVTQAVKPKGD